MRFRLSTLLFSLAFVALILAWLGSASHNNELRNRLYEVEREKEMERARHRALAKNVPPRVGTRRFNEVEFDGMDLSGISITGGSFQKASFVDANLVNASLSGGAASFQAADFTSARLSGATLTGGGSSFQFASFENAELDGSVLAGNFQAATFRNADLRGSVIKASSLADFQNINIDEARFEGADLSSIYESTLSQCYFDSPPTYNQNTVFPRGFDPKANGWKQSD